MTKDENHLRLLSIFHYIVGAISCFFACMPLIHMTIGLLFIFAPDKFQGSKGPGPPEFFGWLFFTVGLIAFLIGQSAAICIIISGRFLAKRTKYYFSFIMACIECVFTPLGTILGVFTIITLSRDSVKALYESNKLKPDIIR